MQKVVVLIVLFYGLGFLLDCSFLNAQQREGNEDSCKNLDPENLVDWKEKRAEDYARPTDLSGLRRFVLDDPRLVNRCAEDVRIIATHLLNRSRNVFEAALALETDPEFEPYITSYIEAKAEYGYRSLWENEEENGEDASLLYDVRIAFSQRSMREHFAHREGEPLKWSLGIDCDMITRNIYVDREYWESLEGKDKFKEILIHHELGHCDLNREHVSHFSLMNDGIITLMEYGMETESQDFYADIYTELFSSFADRRETHTLEHRKFNINYLIDISVSLNRVGLGIDESGLIKAGLINR